MALAAQSADSTRVGTKIMPVRTHTHTETEKQPFLFLSLSSVSENVGYSEFVLVTSMRALPEPERVAARVT